MYISQRKAFWSLAAAFALFFCFSVIPLSWVFLGYNRGISLVAGALLGFVLSPLAAWRFVDTFAQNDRGRYRESELRTIVEMSKWGALWLNPVGWVCLLIRECFVWAGKRWPGFCLFVYLFFTPKKK